MRLLDRYVLRNFFEPFLLCFGGIISIMLIFDLYGNIQDFIEYHTPPLTVARFYLTQLPAMAMLALPVGLLLALLFSLSKMSRHNEIISMLTAGVSVVRVVVPLIIMGILASLLCLVLNTAAAPHAEAIKKQMLEEITRGSRRAEARETVEGHLFRDRQNTRTWFVRRLRPRSDVLEGVHIVQQDDAGNILRKWYANRATFNPKDASWALFQGMIVDFDTNGDIVHTDYFPEGGRLLTGWTETPWRIASSQLLAQNLSIAELHDYLKYNGDFPPLLLAPYRVNLFDRWALPWACLVIVLITAPLGIVYNRRGVLGGVAGAVFLYVCTLALRSLFLALGKGARMDPVLAAWLPNGAFCLIGFILLYYRSTNRELPSLAFWR